MIEFDSLDNATFYSFICLCILFLIALECYLKKVPRQKWLLIFTFSILILFSTYCLLIKTDLINPLDWAVAVGTVILALFAYLAIEDSRKNSKESNESMRESLMATRALVDEIKNIRKSEYIRGQLDELYDPLNKYLDDVRFGKYGEVNILDGIEGKSYLTVSMESFKELSQFISDARYYFTCSKEIKNIVCSCKPDDEIVEYEQQKQKDEKECEKAKNILNDQAFKLQKIIKNEMASLHVQLNKIQRSS